MQARGRSRAATVREDAPTPLLLLVRNGVTVRLVCRTTSSIRPTLISGGRTGHMRAPRLWPHLKHKPGLHLNRRHVLHLKHRPVLVGARAELPPGLELSLQFRVAGAGMQARGRSRAATVREDAPTPLLLLVRNGVTVRLVCRTTSSIRPTLTSGDLLARLVAPPRSRRPDCRLLLTGLRLARLCPRIKLNTEGLPRRAKSSTTPS